MRGFHHREPGIAGFGLMNRHIYVEVIADPFHLHTEAIKLIFALKDPEKIIIVSDSVKKTGKADASLDMTDSQGTLQGGSMTITEAAERLIQLGIEEDLVMSCITSNPASYLDRD
jgi:N-acetylglucosamine-6-phosphate deacetylase